MSAPLLDPELLQAFVAVAERLSFTRAAEQLNRTQAAVSLQVRRLEERLGVPLFRRSTARVELTAAGEDFLADAKRILSVNEQVLAKLTGRQMAGRVRLGVMEDYGTRLLPKLLADAAERFPLVQIDMQTGLTALMLKQIGKTFDAVIAMHPEGSHDGDLICREKAVWVASAGHRPEERAPLPLALSTPDCLFRQWATQALDEAGRPGRLAYVSPSLAAVEAIVRQGLAVTVVKSSMVTPGLRILPEGLLPPLPGAEIRLHRAAGCSALTDMMAEHLAQALRGQRMQPVHAGNMKAAML